MTSSNTAPYVVYNPQTRDYLFEHPDAERRLVTGEALDNPYCHRPVVFDQEMAQSLADVMNSSRGITDWVASLTHADCPSCGRDLWDNDLDVCYPQNRERTSWRIGCNVHDFGCGLEVEGTSYEDVVTRWNAQTLYESCDTSFYVKPTGRRFYAQEKLLKEQLGFAEDAAPEPFLERVAQVSDDPKSPLQFVAKHYLVMALARANW